MTAAGKIKQRIEPAPIWVATAVAVVILLTISAVASARTGKPRATTGGVTNVHAGTGQLEGVVNPAGLECTYDFQYGLTVAYGGQTPPVAVAKGELPVKVGQSISDLVNGEHYRIVATCVGAAQPVYGHDRTYTAGSSNKPKISIPSGKENEITVGYGEPAYLTGTLEGVGNGDQPLTAQGTPYPFTEPFETLPGTAMTSKTGAFSFKVPKLLESTEFRLHTNTSRPLYSHFIVVHVSPRIVLHVQKAHGAGSFRLYGTVAPYIKGAVVVIQQLLPQKASSKREGPAPNSVGSTNLKRTSATLGHFSVKLIFTGTYHYRAFVRVTKGALVSGHSNDQEIRGPRSVAKTHERRKRK